MTTEERFEHAVLNLEHAVLNRAAPTTLEAALNACLKSGSETWLSAACLTLDDGRVIEGYEVETPGGAIFVDRAKWEFTGTAFVPRKKRTRT